nr:MAG TPA: hypothetical protein [Caudoviricetes sp.]
MAKTNNLTDFLTSLALKFRAKLGTSGTINPQDFESKVDDVFEAGKKSEYDAFWDAYQSNGTREDYSSAFGGTGWTQAVFKPKYTVRPSEARNMFYQSVLTDLTLTGKLDLSAVTAISDFIAWSSVTKVPAINLSNVSYYPNALANAKALVTVENLTFPPNPFPSNISLTNFFRQCLALENITITGTIQNTGFDLHWSTKLTIESLTSILTALSKDSSVAAGKSITFPTAAQAKIQADTTAKGQYDAAIAAGWTIAFS